MGDFRRFIDDEKPPSGLAQAFQWQAQDAADMTPKEFKIGDRVEILNADFRGDKATIKGFEENMFKRTLIVVQRDGSTRTTVFYPSELKLLPPEMQGRRIG